MHNCCMPTSAGRLRRGKAPENCSNTHAELGAASGMRVRCAAPELRIALTGVHFQASCRRKRRHLLVTDVNGGHDIGRT